MRSENHDGCNSTRFLKRMPRSQRPAIPRSTHRVSWNQVELVLNTKSYVQLCKEIPDDQFNILFQYLPFATKCFGLFANDYPRLHLIAPIIIFMYFLFNDEVQIEVEEDLGGDFVKDLGHFEFVLRRGDKRVYCVYCGSKEGQYGAGDGASSARL